MTEVQFEWVATWYGHASLTPGPISDDGQLENEELNLMQLYYVHCDGAFVANEFSKKKTVS